MCGIIKLFLKSTKGKGEDKGMNPQAEAVGMLVGLVFMAFFGAISGLSAVHPGLAFLFVFWVALVSVGIGTAFTLKVRGPRRAAIYFGAWSSAFAVLLVATPAYSVAGTKGLLVAAIWIADMVDYVLAVALIAFMVMSRRK